MKANGLIGEGPPTGRTPAGFGRVSCNSNRMRHHFLPTGVGAFAPAGPAHGSGGILDIEASHLALSKTEHVSDRLVFEPVRLPLKRLAFEIADGLSDLRDDRAILSSMKAHRLDVRTDHGPLARPVRAYGLAAMDMAAIHAVGPGDIVGERGQHAVDVPRVEAIVEALEEFQVIVRCVSPRLGARVA